MAAAKAAADSDPDSSDDDAHEAVLPTGDAVQPSASADWSAVFNGATMPPRREASMVSASVNDSPRILHVSSGARRRQSRGFSVVRIVQQREDELERTASFPQRKPAVAPELNATARGRQQLALHALVDGRPPLSPALTRQQQTAGANPLIGSAWGPPTPPEALQPTPRTTRRRRSSLFPPSCGTPGRGPSQHTSSVNSLRRGSSGSSLARHHSGIPLGATDKLVSRSLREFERQFVAPDVAVTPRGVVVENTTPRRDGDLAPDGNPEPSGAFAASLVLRLPAGALVSADATPTGPQQVSGAFGSSVPLTAVVSDGDDDDDGAHSNEDDASAVARQPSLLRRTATQRDALRQYAQARSRFAHAAREMLRSSGGTRRRAGPHTHQPQQAHPGRSDGNSDGDTPRS
uniref:Uncharacterized protein n=1 Tax=Neobodo designis TaxID=312471 RepID=A0A7S1L6S2_NEODS|mmetsp:Transcript_15945/g.49446  ORF Transcript_15945/g.49446 Transcript_15945/m.49446 type:complete len:404 (+) Transcript_15945:3-1214(+)